MTNQVVVTANEVGQVVVLSKNNPEYGYIRLESVVYETVNGWVKKVLRSALLKGRTEHLEGMGMSAGDIIPGKIVVKEQFTPIYSEDVTKGLKRAGKDGPVLKANGKAIYRDTIFTTDVNAQDELITHDNVEEIKEANATKADAVPNFK